MDINNALTVLVFDSGGIKMAIDTAQIEGIVDAVRAEAEKTVLMDISSGGLATAGTAKKKSKVLVLKGKNPPCGIVIDDLEEITTLGIEAIRPLPAFLSSHCGTSAFWGAALRGEEVILLVNPSDIASSGAEKDF